MNTENEVNHEVETIVPAPMPTPGAPPVPSPAEERTWAMVAHLSNILNLVTGFLGVAGALAVYLVYKDRSRYIAFQAMQSFLFQLVFWAGGWLLTGVLAAIAGVLSIVVIGIFLWPLVIVVGLIPFAAVVYSIIAGIQCSNGKDFRYWLVSDWALNLM